MDTKPELGKYYKSSEPYFGWTFYITDVYKDTVIGEIGSGERYFLKEKDWKYWKEVSVKDALEDMDRSAQFFTDWHNNKS